MAFAIGTDLVNQLETICTDKRQDSKRTHETSRMLKTPKWEAHGKQYLCQIIRKLNARINN